MIVPISNPCPQIIWVRFRTPWSHQTGSAATVMDTSSSAIHNRLLLALSTEDLRGILPLMEVVPLLRGQTLTRPDWPILRVYFIESGVSCLFCRAKEPVEIEMIGRSGMIGLPIVLGVGTASFRSVVHLPGRALSLSSNNLRLAMMKYPKFGEVLLRYVHLRLIIEARAVYCRAKHGLEQRLAQWLLKALEHVDGNKIATTHELLSRALAVRRAGITTHLGCMEQQNILQNGRCTIEIIDREKLAARTCDCHKFVQAEYRRLIPIAPNEHFENGGEASTRVKADDFARLEATH